MRSRIRWNCVGIWPLLQMPFLYIMLEITVQFCNNTNLIHCSSVEIINGLLNRNLYSKFSSRSFRLWFKLFIYLNEWPCYVCPAHMVHCFLVHMLTDFQLQERNHAALVIQLSVLLLRITFKLLKLHTICVLGMMNLWFSEMVKQVTDVNVRDASEK